MSILSILFTILYHIKMLTPNGRRIIMDFNGIIEYTLTFEHSADCGCMSQQFIFPDKPA